MCEYNIICNEIVAIYNIPVYIATWPFSNQSMYIAQFIWSGQYLLHCIFSLEANDTTLY